MKVILSVLPFLVLASMVSAQTGREVVRDSSGRIVKAIEHRKPTILRQSSRFMCIRFLLSTPSATGLSDDLAHS